MSAGIGMRPQVIDLAEIDASMVEVVGGKAAGLGEMMRAGFRVPDGCCLTTAAHRSGTVPAEELADAYARLGGGPVAVRSSATGSPMAHGPTVAREYGIPVVIRVRDATSSITTGEQITIDGTVGTVTPES